MKTIVITEYVGLEPEFLSKNMLKPKILESIDEKFLGKSGIMSNFPQK